MVKRFFARLLKSFKNNLLEEVSDYDRAVIRNSERLDGIDRDEMVRECKEAVWSLWRENTFLKVVLLISLVLNAVLYLGGVK